MGKHIKITQEIIDNARKLAHYGMTVDQIAEFFGVCEKTFYNWMNKNPDLLAAVNEGRDVADARVERSLFERATGYSHPEEKIFNNNGKEMRVKTTKHYPPDTTAAIFWLKNRKPKQWRDKSKVDLSSSDGTMSPNGLTEAQRADIDKVLDDEY